MANTKIYSVVKDAELVKELKTLAAAKKLADAEGADVFCDGECVYFGSVTGSDQNVGADVGAFADVAADVSGKTSDGEMSSECEITADVAPRIDHYTLKSKMNIRKAPSMDSEKVGIAEKGRVVEVAAIEGDWMRLVDGTFILYKDGKFAQKV